MSENASFGTHDAGSESIPAAIRTVIKPTRGIIPLRIHELWDYRDLLYFMVWRDLKGRYQQMALGPLWVVLQPLLNMVLYTLLLGVIAGLPSEGKPYAVFTYVALLPWGFFANAVTAGSNSLLESKDLIAKVYFPRLVVPFSRLISGLVDFAVSFLILAAMLAIYRIPPTWGVLLIPAYLLIASIAGLGVGLWFAGIVGRYRDFAHLIKVAVQAWMYATPVVYSITIVPERWLSLYCLNPMTGVTEGFRWGLLGTGSPPGWTLLVSSLIVIPIFIGGLYHFKRVERNIVDIL